MTELIDVRIGNQVLFNPSGLEVTVLKVEDDKVLLDTFPKSSYYTGAHVSGIPLTTSLLQKLSFTNAKNYNIWQGQGINIEMKPDGIFYGLRILKTRAKIQYLHQLQNYIVDFYALFREKKYSLNLNSA